MRFYILVSFFLLTICSGQIFAQQHVKQDSVMLRSAPDKHLNALMEEISTENLEAGSQKKDLRCSFLMLNNLAQAAESIEESQAFDCLDSMLGYIRSLPQFNKKIFEIEQELMRGSTAIPQMGIQQKNSVFTNEIAFSGNF
jgi:hypothetical protein